jgi:hypothetical protein
MVGGKKTAATQQMSIISVQFTLKTATDYTVLLDGETVVEHSQPTLEFNTPILKDHRMHTLDIRGSVQVESLVLDGIDTEYYTHHGFTSDGARGNSDNNNVRYYFQTPVWKWFLEWKQHDDSKYRLISKAHSGFLPL